MCLANAVVASETHDVDDITLVSCIEEIYNSLDLDLGKNSN